MFKSRRDKLRLDGNKSAELDESYSQTISIAWSFAITAGIVGFYFLVYLNWISLPTPLKHSDEASNPGRFIAQIAEEHLANLTRNGPRIGGSPNNEIFAVNFLRSTIEDIIANAKPVHKFEVELQQQNGNVFLNFVPYPRTSVFQGIQNVLVKITPAGAPEPENYLMLGSHFDSVPQSPGAGDAAAMVAVMLEILRQLAQDNSPYQHGIVFVFNGFEENSLQGAQAFAAYHRWWDRIVAFINMDAGSNRGREIMFQAGPKYSFLMEYYRDHVKHPYCTVMAEELFQSGFVPSATDYWVYANIGKRPGMDFAYGTWGYQYHTEYDALDSVPLETLQHTGDNVLPLTRALANAPELLDIENHEGSKVIFFDFLNWFVIYYPDWASTVIHYVMIALGLGLIFGSIIILAKNTGISYGRIVAQLSINFGVQLLSIVIGVGFSILMGVILYAAGGAMSWFTEVWLIAGLYMGPFVICAVLGPILLIKFYKVDYMQLQTRINLFLLGQQLIFLIMLLVMTIQTIRSTYIILIPVIFFNASTIINMILRFKNIYWIYVHLLGQIIPIMYTSHFSLFIFSMSIPLQNRSNAEENPEILISLMAIIVAMMISMFVTPLVAMMRRPFIYLGFLVVFWVMSIIVSVTPVGFPYRAETSPQRYYVFHIERNFYEYGGQLRKSDSHFYIHPLDVHSHSNIMNTVPEMQRATQLGDECIRELYCGIPFYRSDFHARSNVAWWLTADKPVLDPRVDFRFLGKVSVSSTATRYDFSVQGPSHMSFYVSPQSAHKIFAWSFSDEVPSSGVRWNEQDVHYINYVQGVDHSPLQFWIVIEHSDDKPTGETSFNLNIVGQYMNNNAPRTAEFQEFIDNFPDFAHVVAYPSYLESWVF